MDSWLDETISSLRNFDQAFGEFEQSPYPTQNLYAPKTASGEPPKPFNPYSNFSIKQNGPQQNYEQHKQQYATFKTNSTLQVTETPSVHMTPTNFINMVTPTFAEPKNTYHDPNYQLNISGFQSCEPPEQTYQQFKPQIQQFKPQIQQSGSTMQNPTDNFRCGSQKTGVPSCFLDQFMRSPAPTKQITKKKITTSKKKSPVRAVRPKVVAGNGAMQCMGTNMKKGTQCRNAALMEFFGPRPIYCAEHIELDTATIYCKCLCPYNKEVGDGKGCKEVVLKEFSYCYKHFQHRIETYPAGASLESAKNDLTRVTGLLERLEHEAAQAKKRQHDLFQRKKKLLPKFVGMKKTLEEFIEKCDKPEVQKFSAPDMSAFKCPGDLISAADSLLSGMNFDAEWEALLSGSV
mmetsp:Transcript_55364/g.83822  ORF Transcript_55364/g.83822 Transcript_55364/m.83822 type:complete len:404 (+) Transcript_55364:35-1246(+)